MKRKVLIFLVILAVCAVLVAITKGPYYVESRRCVGCGDCENVCPVNVIEIVDGKSVIDPELCIKCDLCVKICTYDAIRKSP
ncbi:indolepyruvate ferredoxin oxidoreductase subunit alpha [Candidatus Cloacimonadota bacterium]